MNVKKKAFILGGTLLFVFQGTAQASTLSLGDKGAEILKLQQALKEKHFYFSTVDGTYGPGTQESVKKFQSSIHIGADGIAGQKTQAALYGSYQISVLEPIPQPSVLQASLFKYGVNGTSVSNLQNRLKQKGFYFGSIDGIYAANTVSAVKAFQLAAGLQADGVAGPVTLKALFSSNAPDGNYSTVAVGPISRSIDNVRKTAVGLIGIPYKWGGTTVSGFDCSGFVQYVYRVNGISLPRTSQQMFSALTPTVNPIAGDLVFFNIDGTGASHVGIALDNGRFINATSSLGVCIGDLSMSYWKKCYIGARSI